MRESRLYQILRVDTAPNQVAVLYEKGLLKRDIKYLTPNQVGGRKSTATDPNQESGVHLMRDGMTYSMSMLDRGKLGAVKSTATDPNQESGVHLMRGGMTYSMSMPDRGRKGSATDPNQESGMHLMRDGMTYSMSMLDRGRKGNATDPGEVEGVHQFENKDGKRMSLSDRGKMGAEKANRPDNCVGTSKIPDLFLSIVEIDDGPPRPMLATCLSTMACYLCSIGAYDKYLGAKQAVSRTNQAINKLMESQPTSEHAITFKTKGRGKRRTFTITKHAEAPHGMKTINIEGVKEHSSQYRHRERVAWSRRANTESDLDMEFEAPKKSAASPPRPST
jgi:hypothetical protein